MLALSLERRRFVIRLSWWLQIAVALVVLVVDESTAQAQEALRPRLLEGAVFWVGEPLSRRDKGAAERVTAIAFSPDGKRVIFGKNNGVATTVDLNSRRTIGSPKGHASEVTTIAFRPGQASYFTAGEDGRVREWGAAENRSVDFRDERFNIRSPLAISPDGKLLALGYYGDKGKLGDAVALYDADSGRKSQVLRHKQGAHSIAFSPDSQFLLCVRSFGNQVQLWNVAKAELTWSRTEGRAYAGEAIDAPFMSGCTFGPNAQEYTVAIDNSWDRASVCIYDLETGSVRKEISSKSGHVKFAISPDGKTLATGGSEPIVEIWDTRTGMQLRKFSGQQERIWSLAFSTDSRLIASGGEDGSVIVWDMTAASKP